MSKRSKLYVAIFALALIAVVVIVWPREPRYEGKSLTFWLERQTSNATNWYLDPQPRVALQHMGTNAIPWLVRKIQYRESTFKQKIANWAANHPRLPLKFTRQYDVTWRGATGFFLLGDQAVPAVPTLKQLMQSDDDILAMCAMVSGSNMGSNSLPILIYGLTNRHANVRREAANLLSYHPAFVGLEERKRAIPALLDLLNDPSETVRLYATNALLIIDPTVAEKVGIKPE